MPIAACVAAPSTSDTVATPLVAKCPTSAPCGANLIIDPAAATPVTPVSLFSYSKSTPGDYYICQNCY